MSAALFEKQSRWIERHCGRVTCSVAPPTPCPRVDYDLVPRCIDGACASEVQRRLPRVDPLF